ncbi:MAG: alpha/beta hydrolase, partial [Chloroflexi bacterium]|nr:alpha/beta hydrolase [Chloroflexota bacterium]
MDAPPIQYARTEDGVNIAYWTLGEGPAVVIAPGSNLSHASKEWEIPTYRRWYTELSERFRVIRYDPRGLGLSDLEINDASLTNMVVDLSAVLDAAGVDRAALIGQFWFGPTVTQFAASHPDRVSCLVLWGTQASNQMLAESEIMRSMSSLMKTSWDTAVTVLLSAVPSEDKPGWERHLHYLRPDQPA